MRETSSSRATLENYDKTGRGRTHHRRWFRDSCSCPNAEWDRDVPMCAARRALVPVSGRFDAWRRWRSRVSPRCRTGIEGRRRLRRAPIAGRIRRSPWSRTCGTAETIIDDITGVIMCSPAWMIFGLPNLPDSAIRILPQSENFSLADENMRNSRLVLVRRFNSMQSSDQEVFLRATWFPM